MTTAVSATQAEGSMRGVAAKNLACAEGSAMGRTNLEGMHRIQEETGQRCTMTNPLLLPDAESTVRLASQSVLTGIQPAG